VAATDSGTECTTLTLTMTVSSEVSTTTSFADELSLVLSSVTGAVGESSRTNITNATNVTNTTTNTNTSCVAYVEASIASEFAVATTTDGGEDGCAAMAASGLDCKQTGWLASPPPPPPPPPPALPPPASPPTADHVHTVITVVVVVLILCCCCCCCLPCCICLRRRRRKGRPVFRQEHAHPQTGSLITVNTMQDGTLRVSDPLVVGEVFSFYHVLWKEKVPAGMYAIVAVSADEVGCLVAIRSATTSPTAKPAFWGMFFNPPSHRRRRAPTGPTDLDESLARASSDGTPNAFATGLHLPPIRMQEPRPYAENASSNVDSMCKSEEMQCSVVDISEALPTPDLQSPPAPLILSPSEDDRGAVIAAARGAAAQAIAKSSKAASEASTQAAIDAGASPAAAAAAGSAAAKATAGGYAPSAIKAAGEAAAKAAASGAAPAAVTSAGDAAAKAVSGGASAEAAAAAAEAAAVEVEAGGSAEVAAAAAAAASTAVRGGASSAAAAREAASAAQAAWRQEAQPRWRRRLRLPRRQR